MVKQPQKSWKKDELIAYAKEHGISVNKNLKKDEIIDRINKESGKKSTVSEPSKKEKATPPTGDEKPETIDKGEVQIIDTGEYIPKKKPEIDKKIKQDLSKKNSAKKPNFLRQEWFRYKRLKNTWRRPRGRHSKMRKNLKYRPPKVRIGYRNPEEIRGLHPSGFEDILIYNVNDLDNINPKKQAARIAHTVGGRKRAEIEEKAEEKGIRILNRRR
jgi:large subunit ribosomal protein L32e